MRKLSDENPFGAIPKGAVWEALKCHGESINHLDYGGYDGEALMQFKKTGLIKGGVSFDLNSEIVAGNSTRMPRGTRLEVIKKGEKLPLADKSVSTISAIGVVEHIADQKAVLDEFRRVLRDDGILILAVPGKHLFSFLDMGNWKFVFPRGHRLMFSMIHSKDEYKRRYIDCDNGMFGDIETEKMWHEHFSVATMKILLKQSGFKLTDHDGLGFFQRIIANAMYFMPKVGRQVLKKLHEWDARRFSKAELCFVAVKSNI